MYLIFIVCTFFYSGTPPCSLLLWSRWSLELHQLLLWGREGSATSLSALLPPPPPLTVCLCVEGVGWGCKRKTFCSHSAISVDPRGSFGNLEMLFLGEWWWYCVVAWGCIWSSYHFHTMWEECQRCSRHPTDSVGWLFVFPTIVSLLLEWKKASESTQDIENLKLTQKWCFF